MAIKCANCGQELRDNARFCNSCGAPLILPSWMHSLDRGAHPTRPPQKNETLQREMRSKVWESKELGVPAFSEEDTIFPDDSDVFPGDSFENLPTKQMKANYPEPPILKAPGTAPASSTWDFGSDDITQRPTHHLISQRQIKPEDQLKQQGARQFPGPLPMPLEGVVFQKPPQTPQLRPGPPFQAISSTQDIRQPSLVPPTPIETQFKVPPSMPPESPGRQKKSRKRLLFVLVLLFVLIAGGIAAWLITVKPFAVASITQPWQQFCDSGVGVSGQYPTGWTKQVDPNKSVRFTDGTDQFNVTSTAANGQDAGTYLKKEATQLGITSLKPGTPASFAGTTWQQAQGNLLSSQTGVTYTETLLVTVHSNNLFTIMQIAPPGTYNEEDATIFSGMRSFFQFSNNCP